MCAVNQVEMQTAGARAGRGKGAGARAGAGAGAPRRRVAYAMWPETNPPALNDGSLSVCVFGCAWGWGWGWGGAGWGCDSNAYFGVQVPSVIVAAFVVVVVLVPAVANYFWLLFWCTFQWDPQRRGGPRKAKLKLCTHLELPTKCGNCCTHLNPYRDLITCAW